MKGFITILIIISALFFLGTIRYVFEWKRPGVYPPKQLLKKRASVLAQGGGIFLLIAVMFSFFL